MPRDTPRRWEDDAACRDLDPELFFPDRAEGRTNHGTEAKAVCAGCPVTRECLVAAIRRREKHGVWGGAGEPTRRRLGKLAGYGAAVDAHPPDCTCPFCVSVREHVGQLRRAFAVRVVIHGHWEAFVHAGCRCARCANAYRQSGRYDPPT